MNPDTIFVSRYVASHAEALPWYESLFGRPADERPMPSCQEWHFGESVILQVIEDPKRAGETSTALRVADLDDLRSRRAGAGFDIAEPQPVEGFTSLRFTEVTDPDGVAIGLLDGE